MTPAPREKIGGGGGFPRADFLVGRRSSDHAGPAGTPTMRDATAAAGEKVKAADIDRRAIRYRNKVDTGRHRRLGFSQGKKNGTPMKATPREDEIEPRRPGQKKRSVFLIVLFFSSLVSGENGSRARVRTRLATCYVIRLDRFTS